jgi:hypothetical protein
MCGRRAKTRLHRYSAFRTCELGATGNVEAGRQIANGGHPSQATGGERDRIKERTRSHAMLASTIR